MFIYRQSAAVLLPLTLEPLSLTSTGEGVLLFNHPLSALPFPGPLYLCIRIKIKHNGRAIHCTVRCTGVHHQRCSMIRVAGHGTYILRHLLWGENQYCMLYSCTVLYSRAHARVHNSCIILFLRGDAECGYCSSGTDTGMVPCGARPGTVQVL